MELPECTQIWPHLTNRGDLARRGTPVAVNEENSAGTANLGA